MNTHQQITNLRRDISNLPNTNRETIDLLHKLLNLIEHNTNQTDKSNQK